MSTPFPITTQGRLYIEVDGHGVWIQAFPLTRMRVRYQVEIATTTDVRITREQSINKTPIGARQYVRR
jgi:hypothetical protein